jgi:hypothetical protein
MTPLSGLVLATVSVIAAVGCSNGGDESFGTASSSPSPTLAPVSQEGGPPPANLTAVLRTLPVYPAAILPDGRHPDGGSMGDNLMTGFNVPPGTSVDDVVSFFAGHLALAGWQQEAEPSTETSNKAGSFSETVIWRLVNDDFRLGIIIPLTHKDAPSGVTNVELVLVPKEIQIFGSPVATAIDSTPPPGPTQPTLQR